MVLLSDIRAVLFITVMFLLQIIDIDSVLTMLWYMIKSAQLLAAVTLLCMANLLVGRLNTRRLNVSIENVVRPVSSSKNIFSVPM